MQKHLSIINALLLLLGFACSRPLSTKNTLDQLLTHFPIQAGLPDTLHCFLDESPKGTAISDSLLKTVLDSTQFENLHFGTGEAKFIALGQFPFAKGLRAGLLQTQEFWFGKLSLLVFASEQQKCLAVVELSHFYGGDGGQTAAESWLFRDQVQQQLFVKNAEHGLSPGDNPRAEPQEYLREQGQLYQWKETHFQRLPIRDSAAYMQRFLMQREW
jgi:hypothetical protein